jgi:hypothetical protein
MQIKLDLHLDVVNAVLTALAKLPYEQSAPVINLIQQQAGPQVEAAQAEAKANEVTDVAPKAE